MPVLPGRECVKCGRGDWNYPECPPDRSRVKVTCAGCGKYIGHFDYDWKMRSGPLLKTNAPEDQVDVRAKRGKKHTQASIDFETSDDLPGSIPDE